jgi:plasmid maintenance system antidote protein VapI
MTRKPHAKKSRAAQFIARRVYDLQSRKTQGEIAAAAGFKSAGMISMIISGRAKLPIERALDLAKALECEPSVLVRLALEQTLSETVLEEIFSPPSRTITTPTLVSHQASNAALAVQVLLALREMSKVRAFAYNVSSRADRVSTHLEAIRKELDLMAPTTTWLSPTTSSPRGGPTDRD